MHSIVEFQLSLSLSLSLSHTRELGETDRQTDGRTDIDELESSLKNATTVPLPGLLHLGVGFDNLKVRKRFPSS